MSYNWEFDIFVPSPLYIPQRGMFHWLFSLEVSTFCQVDQSLPSSSIFPTVFFFSFFYLWPPPPPPDSWSFIIKGSLAIIFLHSLLRSHALAFCLLTSSNYLNYHLVTFYSRGDSVWIGTILHCLLTTSHFNSLHLQPISITSSQDYNLSPSLNPWHWIFSLLW